MVSSVRVRHAIFPSSLRLDRKRASSNSDSNVVSGLRHLAGVVAYIAYFRISMRQCDRTERESENIYSALSVCAFRILQGGKGGRREFLRAEYDRDFWQKHEGEKGGEGGQLKECMKRSIEHLLLESTEGGRFSSGWDLCMTLRRELAVCVTRRDAPIATCVVRFCVAIDIVVIVAVIVGVVVIVVDICEGGISLV